MLNRSIGHSITYKTLDNLLKWSLKVNKEILPNQDFLAVHKYNEPWSCDYPFDIDIFKDLTRNDGYSSNMILDDKEWIYQGCYNIHQKIKSGTNVITIRHISRPDLCSQYILDGESKDTLCIRMVGGLLIFRFHEFGECPFCNYLSI